MHILRTTLEQERMDDERFSGKLRMCQMYQILVMESVRDCGVKEDLCQQKDSLQQQQ